MPHRPRCLLGAGFVLTTPPCLFAVHQPKQATQGSRREQPGKDRPAHNDFALSHQLSSSHSGQKIETLSSLWGKPSHTRNCSGFWLKTIGAVKEMQLTELSGCDQNSSISSWRFQPNICPNHHWPGLPGAAAFIQPGDNSSQKLTRCLTGKMTPSKILRRLPGQQKLCGVFRLPKCWKLSGAPIRS